MPFSDNDFARDVYDNQDMKSQIEHALEETHTDVCENYTDVLKNLDAPSLVKVIKANYRKADGSGPKPRKEIKPTQETGYAYATIVQCALKLLGKYDHVITGRYSPATKNAVGLFQGENTLKRDGWVGDKTFAALVDKLSGIPSGGAEKKDSKQNKSDTQTEVTASSKGSGTVEKPTELQTMIPLRKMLDMKPVEYEKTYPTKTVAGPWSIKIEKSGIKKELPVNVMKAINITIANDSKDRAKIFFEQYKNGPTMYAYVFYKAMKGGGTREKVFETALSYAIKNNQLSNAIKCFDNLSEGTFFDWILGDFDAREYGALFLQIASTAEGKEYLHEMCLNNNDPRLKLTKEVMDKIGIREEITKSLVYGQPTQRKYVLM